VVARTVVHVAAPQGATPSIHPNFGDVHVSDCARKPAGIADTDRVARDAAAGPTNEMLSRTARQNHVAVGIVVWRDLISISFLGKPPSTMAASWPARSEVSIPEAA